MVLPDSQFSETLFESNGMSRTRPGFDSRTAHSFFGPQVSLPLPFVRDGRPIITPSGKTQIENISKNPGYGAAHMHPTPNFIFFNEKTLGPHSQNTQNQSKMTL